MASLPGYERGLVMDEAGILPERSLNDLTESIGVSGRSPRIAVLMTCHNRLALTLTCLETLRDQTFFREDDLYLVDDGSTDGTGQAVAARMPKAQVIAGDGSLFWNGGMRLAWSTARDSGRDYDFYLWLNDDVSLAPGSLASLVADAGSYVAPGEPVIVAAATIDPASGEVNYGAHRRSHLVRPLRLELIQPNGSPQRADTISGNIVLVSAAAERLLGNLAPQFEHIFGDIEYSLRAAKVGVPIILAGAVGGTCASNGISGTSLDRSLSKVARLRRRWAEAKSVHARDWLRLVRLHGGGRLATGIHRLSPYLRILLDRSHQLAT